MMERAFYKGLWGRARRCLLICVFAVYFDTNVCAQLV